MSLVYGLGAQLKKIICKRSHWCYTHLPLFAYVYIFMVLTGLFNLCVFFVLMAKIGLGIFYSLSVDPGLDCRRYKVFPLKPTKTDKFNQSKTTIPLLMKCGDEPIFFWLSYHARLNSHYEGWSYKKTKKMKIIEGTV